MSTTLYDDPIIKLAESAGSQESMENPDFQATATNALCGDRVTVQLKMDGPGIARLAYQVRGCLLSKASCAVLASLAAGLDLARLRDLRDTLERFLKSSGHEQEVPRELLVFAAVRPRKSRHRCVLLPYDAALKALESAGISD
ncbi:MAG: iron-sulfur cluster assembly scaffold protein [Desulfomonilia bacterium]